VGWSLRLIGDGISPSGDFLDWEDDLDVVRKKCRRLENRYFAMMEYVAAVFGDALI
jgi:hypothetical protein